jgi:hypothetical protein
MNKDGSGEISIREMQRGDWSTEFGPAASDALSTFDADGSGTGSFEEMLRALFLRASLAAVRQMMRELDGTLVLDRS